MRISIATGPLLPVPPVRGGAIPRIWHGMAQEFARHGHEVCIVARSYPGQPDNEVVGNLRYVRIGGFSQSRWVVLDLLKGLVDSHHVARHLPEADILVTNDFWLPVFAKRAAGRIVVNANRFPKGQYFLYRRVARIAAASSAVRDAIALQTPMLRDRIRIFPNPIDTGIMFPTDNRERSKSARVLLFVGRLHPEKGVHVLVEAFARIAVRHSGWRLRIVGPWREGDGGGGESYVQRLKDLLGDAPGQIDAPQFDAATLAADYRAADLFCYPSLAEQGESFGVAVLEAMACGTPPIVSSLECFRDFVTDGETGWEFNHRLPNPADTLAAVLEKTMVNSAHARAVGEEASVVARQFGYAQVAAAYLEDFANILSGGLADA